ncbi:glycine zipper family protein [Bacteroides sp.]|uniref:glycine zipper family protein n=1 Tax=Bacteroides sp. TaxID=29523 RepID=UPI003AB50DC8
MKKQIAILTAALLMLASCGTGRMASGDPGAVLAGAAIGGNVGSAIGGLIGDSNGGWRGGYRGSAIGSIIGTVAGAAIANAATAPKKQEEYSYRIEPSPRAGRQEMPSAVGYLRIHNIRFIDDSRDHVINSNEHCKVIFEIVNEGDRTAYNVVPIVAETSGMKRIYISPSVMIEQMAPGDGMKYTASIHAEERIKTGNITLHIAVSDEYGNEYDWQEFSLPTQR